MSIGATDNVFLMTVGLTSLDHLARLMRQHFVHVHLDCAIPAGSDNCVVVASIGNERDLTIKWVMFLEFQCHHTRLQVKDLELTLVTADDQFTMMLVEDHLGDFCCENILDHSDRFACFCFPNLDILLSGHENLESFLAKEHLADSLIISIVWDEGPGILEDSELTGATDQPSVLGYGSDAFDLNVGISDIESLNTAVIEDVPDLDHALGVSSYETVETGKAIDTNKRMLVTVQCHDRFYQVRVPNEDIEVETARDKNLVLITVSHLSDSTFMTN